MFKLGSLFLILSAVFHVVAVVLSRFSPDAMILLLPAVVYVPLAWALNNRQRWAAWITFIFMLVGMIGALSNINSGSSVPDWLFYTIALLDILVAGCMFVVLWRPKPTPIIDR